MNLVIRNWLFLFYSISFFLCFTIPNTFSYITKSRLRSLWGSREMKQGLGNVDLKRIFNAEKSILGFPLFPFLWEICLIQNLKQFLNPVFPTDCMASKLAQTSLSAWQAETVRKNWTETKEDGELYFYYVFISISLGWDNNSNFFNMFTTQYPSYNS